MWTLAWILAAIVGIASGFSAPAWAVESDETMVPDAIAMARFKDKSELALLKHSVQCKQLERYIYDITDNYTYYNKSRNPIQVSIELPLASSGYWGTRDTRSIDIRKMIARHEVFFDGRPVRANFRSSKFGDYFELKYYTFDQIISPLTKIDVVRKYQLRTSFIKPNRYFVEIWAGVPLKTNFSEFQMDFDFTNFTPTNVNLYKSAPGGSKQPFFRKTAFLLKRNSFFDSDDLFPTYASDDNFGRPRQDYKITYSGGPSHHILLIVERPKSAIHLNLSYGGFSDSRDSFSPILSDMYSDSTGPERRESCTQELRRFHNEWSVSDDLLSCFAPEDLENYILAARGIDFQNEKLNELFYGQHYFRKSDVPFSESWLTAAQKAAVAKLKDAAK